MSWLEIAAPRRFSSAKSCPTTDVTTRRALDRATSTYVKLHQCHVRLLGPGVALSKLLANGYMDMQSCPVAVITLRVGLCFFFVLVGGASVDFGHVPKAA
jgi:hypothetical protein